MDAVLDEAIALVNGKAITTEDFARAVAMVASDKRTAITDADRAHVLNRLIDEELLVQDGIAMGLVESNRAVRQALTQAMLAAIVSERVSARPSEEALRTFYEKNRSLFVRSAQGERPPLARGEEEEPGSFGAVRAQVEEVYLQRARDEALREYLAWLRSEAKVVLRLEAGPGAVDRTGRSYERE